MSDWVYLYLIEHPDGYVKIGKAVDLMQRKNGIQTGSPYELRLVAYAKYLEPGAYIEHDTLEKQVHSHFEDSRVRGEWFDVCAREVIHAIVRTENWDGYDDMRVTDAERERQRKEQYKSNYRITYEGPL